MTLLSHPRRRAGTALAVLVAVTALLFGSSIAAEAAPTEPTVAKLVALGDSYAAGQGAGAALDACLRTSAAYPVLLDAAPKLNLLRTGACSGATISDVMSTQLSQINRGTTLVTLTVGANDVGAGSVYAACAPDPDAPVCYQALAAAEAALSEIPAQTAELVRAIAERAPKAEIVVTDYPIPFRADINPLLNAVNGYTHALNLALAAGASSTGANVTVVGVEARFLGHAVGDPDPWLGGDPADLITFLHPTTAGQAAYAAAILAAL